MDVHQSSIFYVLIIKYGILVEPSVGFIQLPPNLHNSCSLRVFLCWVPSLL